MHEINVLGVFSNVNITDPMVNMISIYICTCFIKYKYSSPTKSNNVQQTKDLYQEAGSTHICEIVNKLVGI